jgi:hypothetical protein
MALKADLERLNQQQIDAENAALEEEAFQEFFTRHADLDLQANRNVLKNYINYPITFDLL